MYYLKFSIVEKYFLTENQTRGFATGKRSLFEW